MFAYLLFEAEYLCTMHGRNLPLLALYDDGGKKFVFDMARDRHRTIPTGFHFAVIDHFEEFFHGGGNKKRNMVCGSTFMTFLHL